jgi:hypothetical protein
MTDASEISADEPCASNLSTLPATFPFLPFSTGLTSPLPPPPVPPSSPSLSAFSNRLNRRLSAVSERPFRVDYAVWKSSFQGVSTTTFRRLEACLDEFEVELKETKSERPDPAERPQSHRSDREEQERRLSQWHLCTTLESLASIAFRSTHSAISLAHGPVTSSELIDALTSGNVNDVKQLQQFVEQDPECLVRLDKAGETVLHLVCKLESPAPRLVALLLAAGANPDARSTSGRTPLHYSVASDNYDEVSLLLLAAKVDINAKDKSGITPLHEAAQGAFSDSVALLLAAGADSNATTERNETPLHLAAIVGYSPSIALLLAAGADPYVETEGNSRRPVELAAENRKTRAILLFFLHWLSSRHVQPLMPLPTPSMCSLSLHVDHRMPMRAPQTCALTPHEIYRQFVYYVNYLLTLGSKSMLLVQIYLLIKEVVRAMASSSSVNQWAVYQSVVIELSDSDMLLSNLLLVYRLSLRNTNDFFGRPVAESGTCGLGFLLKPVVFVISIPSLCILLTHVLPGMLFFFWFTFPLLLVNYPLFAILRLMCRLPPREVYDPYHWNELNRVPSSWRQLFVFLVVAGSALIGCSLALQLSARYAAMLYATG